jgi:hypothetical protein
VDTKNNKTINNNKSSYSRLFEDSRRENNTKNVTNNNKNLDSQRTTRANIPNNNINKPPVNERKPNISIKANHTNSVKQNNVNYSPLNTPQRLRDNENGSPKDPFNIHPLPGIQASYFSAREPSMPIPNLESWGIKNQPRSDGDNLSFNRLNSPYLPVFNALSKGQKPYVVVPQLYNNNFNGPLPQQQPTYINYDLDQRLNYISAIPYQKHNFKSIFDQNDKQNSQLKSDEYVKSAQDLLAKSSVQNANINKRNTPFEDLFNIDDFDSLEYNKSPMKTLKDGNKKPLKFKLPSTVKEENGNDSNNNLRAIEIAEQVYSEEIRNFVRDIAEESLKNKQAEFYQNLERPFYNNLYGPVLIEMTRQVVNEVVKEERENINAKESREINRAAEEKIVSNLLLDKLLDTITQHGRVVAENENVSNLLDSECFI